MQAPSIDNTQAGVGETTSGRTAAVKNGRKARAVETGPASAIIADLPGLKIGSLMQSIASLFWLPQAALLAYSVHELASSSHFNAIIFPALLVLVLGILRALLDMIGNRMIFKAARNALTRLRQMTARALATRSPLDNKRLPSGAAASLIAEQTEAILPFLLRFQPVQYKLVIIPITILICVGSLSWLAALVLIITAPLIPFFMALVGYRAQKASEDRMVEVGSMNAFLLDRLRGLTSIRALDAVDATALRFRISSQSLKQRTMAVLRIAFLSSGVLELFSMLGIALVAVYVGYQLLGQLSFGAWGERLTLGQGLFILLLAPAFFEPLQELSAAWHDRASGKAAIIALNRISDDTIPLPGSLEAEVAPATPCPAPPAVELSHLSFRHRDAPKPVLEDYSLTVSSGEKLALLGPSGSGKSTLLAILGGLIPAQSGVIRIGETDLDGDNAARLRQRISWIGQKPHIFSGSLRSNITLGRKNIGLQAVAEAMQGAALTNVAATHPGSVGEGGSGLSGGEALRLALARAMVTISADLILADEPTAHLDSTTASDVADGIIALAKGRTLIVATHDEAFASRMDRIIRLGSPA